MKKINKQLKKEAIITSILYLIYFIWWYYFAYGLGAGDPKDYKYILGLPEWFFYSCILGFLVITTLLWFVIKVFFKDIDFKPHEKQEGEK
ncbi:MAG: DUF997 domain-containing protein [Fusobacteria bacterium]|nr:MAG: DUF997 domain-containing protein [Fusobacteriota bacterium]